MYEKSKKHSEAYFSFKVFGGQLTAIGYQGLEALSRHNDNVRTNREVLTL